MHRADKGEDGPLAELIARSVTTNLYRFVLPAIAGPVKLVPLAALATDDLSEGAFRVAANRGRLRVMKAEGGGWRSSRNWVDQYAATKHQRGHSPSDR